MKRVYVNEDWCLGCHLCEYYCGLSNSGMSDMVKAFKQEKKPIPRCNTPANASSMSQIFCTFPYFQSVHAHSVTPAHKTRSSAPYAIKDHPLLSIHNW